MRWEKKGLIYKASGKKKDWMYSAALTPTPILLNDSTIRVYFGARDINGISRIAYVDLDASNPSIILDQSKSPVLDIGKPGCFDDNGIILGDVIKVGDEIYMFYVGFQKVEKVKFLAFSGLALSTDNGNSFSRIQSSPILDRSDEGICIRAIHTVIKENDIWKVWYAAGKEWTYINDIPYPNYQIFYTESQDILSLPRQGTLCVSLEGNEYRIGRPRVYKTGDGYKMYYTKGCTSGSYFPGIAFSSEGKNWKRDDKKFELPLSENSWDSRTLCYPSVIKTEFGTYMFYNGNNMGEDGFGYAVLAS